MKRTSPPKVMAFFCNGLGDALMTLPAVRALAARFGDQLLLVADEDFRQFVSRDLPALECHAIRFWKDGSIGKCFDPEELLAIERRARASTFVSLVPWTSPSLQDYLARTGCLAFGHFDGFHVRVPYREDEHAALNAFKFAKAFAPQAEYAAYARPLPLRPRELEFGDRVIGALPAGAVPVLVHLETGLDKRLPPRWVNQVLTCLALRRPDLVFINIGRNPPAIELGECSGTVLDLGNDSIFEALAVAARCHLFFGVDSCFLHAADMYRLPGVGVFRNTDPVEFGYVDTPNGVTYRAETFPDSTAPHVADMLAERVAIGDPFHQESI